MSASSKLGLNELAGRIVECFPTLKVLEAFPIKASDNSELNYRNSARTAPTRSSKDNSCRPVRSYLCWCARGIPQERVARLAKCGLGWNRKAAASCRTPRWYTC
jgi:hypothetical protein